jgi:hypothetical protein
MARFKFISYVILMSFVCGALGAFLGLCFFLFLGPNALPFTLTHFVELCAILGAAFGLWMGWDEGAKLYTRHKADPAASKML